MFVFTGERCYDKTIRSVTGYAWYFNFIQRDRLAFRDTLWFRGLLYYLFTLWPTVYLADSSSAIARKFTAVSDSMDEDSCLPVIWLNGLLNLTLFSSEIVTSFRNNYL